MAEYIDRYPSELSGGQQQRVAVARMIAAEPGIFLMDEPLSNLDAMLRIDMRAELKHLHHELGATTVYVTHDQIEALTLSDKIAVMDQGLLRQIGHPGGNLYHAGGSVCGQVCWKSQNKCYSGRDYLQNMEHRSSFPEISKTKLFKRSIFRENASSEPFGQKILPSPERKWMDG